MNPNNVKIRHTPIGNQKDAQALATLDNICTAGASCPAVTASPVAAGALAGLKTAVAAAHTSLTSRIALAQSLLAAINALHLDIGAVRVALTTYEAAVGALPGLDAGIIGQAGLLTRAAKQPPATLGNATGLYSTPGKHPTEGILRWPPVPGATGYAIEVNTTPQNPAGTWTAIASGSSRRRVVKGPTPSSQILARVAAVGSDGTQSDWSAPLLVTTA